MKLVACIVEGHSEVESLPILLERIFAWRCPDTAIHVARQPVRVARDGFINKQSEFHRYVRLAAAKVGPGDGVLILLDADKDCPAELGAIIRQRAERIAPDRSIAVVLAKYEFEAWLIAGARSLARIDQLPADQPLPEPESIQGAKDWLDRRMSTGYRSRIDQPRLAAALDLESVERLSRSFRKLTSECGRLAAPHA